MIPTPHIQVDKQGVIAETVLLPGDPLRAKYIAEKYLKNPVLFNEVRNMFGFTGEYAGKKVSVMGTGMGMPSMGIYSYELINFYGVKNLIRIGSCGSLNKEVKVRDIVIAMSACTDSNYALQYKLPGNFAPTASWDLLSRVWEKAKEKSIQIKVGSVVSTDIFYNDDPEAWKQWAKMGVVAVEMEAAALYMNAARASVNSLCILTVSDSLVTHEQLNSQERQCTFDQMVELALSLN